MAVANTPFDLVVIGGGFAGLAAAHEALKNGKAVCVVEARLRAGGLASGTEIGSDWSVDNFYHHWFESDSHIFDFLSELNLEKNIVKCEVETGVLTDSGCFKLDSASALFKFPLFGIISKFRFLLFLAICWLPLNPHFLHRITAKNFISFVCGRKVYDVLWAPLLRSKFEKYAEEISAAWIYKKINLRSRNSSGKGESLYYYAGGFQKCVDDVVDFVRSKGCNFEFGINVLDVVKENKFFHLKCSDGSEIISNKILVSSRRSALTLMKDWLPNDVRQKYSEFKSMANVCVALTLEAPISKFYWLSNCSSSSDWVAVIEHTNLVSREHYDGRHIVYLSRYISPNSDFYNLSNGDLIENAVSFITNHFPHISQNQVTLEKCIVNRAIETQPVISSSKYRYFFPYMFEDWGVLSMEQIFPEDRGTNYAVREGKKVYHELMA
ncbi:FAD-dependent oxidoreductase [Roseobacter sp. HKCCD5988]|uniref:FAD-dependent oxidoreductase n=1 Tax=Roseobacter sp. HKCCD5988 TaxID=3120338 RepID=UPI0030ED66F8